MYNQKPLSGDLINYGHPLSQGIVFFPPFNEGNNSNKVFDLSGNGNIGTLQGNTYWTPGRFGPVPYFDGVDDFITLTNTISFADNVPWSVSFWAEQVSGASALGMAMGDISTNSFIWLYEGNYFRVRNTVGIDVDFALTDFTGFHHYVVVANGTYFTLYRDGVFINTLLPTGGDTSFLLTLIGRGYTATNFDFKGWLDLPMVYNHGLTASEAKLLYREPFCMIRTKRRIIYDEIAGAPPGSFPYYYREIASRRIA